MPTKIAEAQYHHLAEREGILSLTLAFNGDPVSLAALDNFAFEVKARFKNKRGQTHAGPDSNECPGLCPIPAGTRGAANLHG
jgi:hypothetical protein